MRTIKFRAWYKINKEMRDWDRLKQNPMQVMEYAVKNIFYMQFTGLFDKNWMEIYEGDIVKTRKDAFGNDTGKIVFNKDTGCYAIDYGNDVFNLLYAYESVIKDCKVIGNIYENPELLTN